MRAKPKKTRTKTRTRRRRRIDLAGLVAPFAWGFLLAAAVISTVCLSWGSFVLQGEGKVLNQLVLSEGFAPEPIRIVTVFDLGFEEVGLPLLALVAETLGHGWKLRDEHPTESNGVDLRGRPEGRTLELG